MPKGKKKALSAERVTAMNAVKNAKSDQEKRVATQQLKMLRFKEIATKRVNRAIKSIKGLQNLANRGAYGWTPEQAEKILSTLDKQMRALRDKLSGTKVEEEAFTL